MSVSIRIQKEFADFKLDVEIKSTSRRIGILGASGCGKSMTLKCIAGIETPKRGEITVNGRVLFDSVKKINIKPQKRGVGYLFQNYALFPAMTVQKNIAAGLRGKEEEVSKRVREMVSKFHLEGLEKRLPGELSGGQQQRVALARIMAYEPDVILLDEPFSALDWFLKDRLQQEMIEMLEDYEGTVVLVSHSRDEIYRMSEELVILDEGRVVCAGRTKEVFQSPGTKEAARLTGCKNIVRAERKDRHRLDIPDWGISLQLHKEIPEEICYIGVRAHDFVPVWGNTETSTTGKIPVIVKSIAQLPFEQKYFLQSTKGDEEICWFVQREQQKILEEKGLPDYLGLLEEKILLLKM